ncbi:1,2-phenylacetyl-CoA epoxidase subunit PaaE [Pedococcus sp. 5OH_020]|uniref:1,2-phenylacetyl-CoA epoxidase subunit PaaE n=1 Tax=Pedococcus sp. 5OH_020 TaxID=2989814 RepID=UPI0022E9A80D|nr:1,2-phenylacetyl-CoA epoxidase subunit PaaE [Pedococcus sp. 5OH_020]
MSPSPGSLLLPRKPRTAPTFHTLTVHSVERLTEDAVAVSFDVPPELAAAYAFAAGQSLTLRRVIDGREERRTYSICAPAGQRPRIGVREIPDGLFSHWLVHEVTPGTAIEVQTPSGSFRADPATGGRHLCIAAGSGITPVLSIAGTMLSNPDAEVTLVYGNRTTGSVMFAEELADLKNRYGARFQLIHVLSREPRDVELFSGRLDAHRLRRLLELLVPVHQVDDVWLCGPFEMTQTARQVLGDVGVPQQRVHSELFYVDEPPPELHRPDPAVEGLTSDVTVVLDGVSSTTAMPRSKAILDSAQASRSDVPFACKGGVCGTCRALVREGEVDLRRNYALEKGELAAGFVLTCQTFPVSDRVTVDFDA